MHGYEGVLPGRLCCAREQEELLLLPEQAEAVRQWDEAFKDAEV